MTQTSDDSSNNATTSSDSTTVIMNHDTEGKATDTGTAAVDEEGKLNEPKATVAKTEGADPDICATTTISSDTRSTNGSAVAVPFPENCVVAEMDITGDTSSLPFSKAPMCAVCSEPCICYCKTCKKVSYCSKEHQKLHFKQHRPECYPVIVQVNSVFGSNLVVTRDIKRGEVILREKPLFFAPSPLCDPRGNDYKPSSISHQETENSNGIATPGTEVCLTCHKILSGDISSSSCSKCGWPICCPECEKNPTHGDQECKIFAEYHLEPSALCDKDAQYMCVSLLRVLLHKKWNPTKWSQFMDVVNKQAPMKDGLNSQAEAKKSTARFSDLITKSLGSIIHKEFSLTDVEIDQIVRTLRTTAFITDKEDGNDINGFGPGHDNNLGHISARNISRRTRKTVSVYHLASMLTSNCVPNASWVIQETLEFYLRASTPIKTGERITITYIDPLLGTWDRRRELWKEKYLSCSCSRCADPTELGTFFSAIKCPGEEGVQGGESSIKRECEGYILLQDPLAVTYTSYHAVRQEENDGLPEEKLCEERMAEWKCNVCLMRQPWSFVRNSLERMGISLQDENIYLRNDGSGGGSSGSPEADNPQNGDELMESSDLIWLETRVDKLENIVKNYAHMNHYNVLKMENDVLTGISTLLEKGQVPFDEMEKWALKMVEYCKKGLKVVNVICPGLSRPRGRLLYFLQQGLAISLLFKTSRAMRITSFSSESSTDSMEAACNDDLAKKFQELLLARKEILEIFALERESSEEKAMLKAVQHDSIEIRVLKKHFKYHQNMCCYSNSSNTLQGI